jgi:hypothetical protein
MRQHRQLQRRLPGLARGGQVDLGVGQQTRLRVDFQGHVGDQPLPRHQRRPQGFGDLRDGPAKGVPGRVAYSGGQSITLRVHSNTQRAGARAARLSHGGNAVTIADSAVVAGAVAAWGGRP